MAFAAAENCRELADPAADALRSSIALRRAANNAEARCRFLQGERRSSQLSFIAAYSDRTIMDSSQASPYSELHTPENDLNTLVRDYGLIAVLEAVKNLIETRAQILENSVEQPVNHQTETFWNTAHTLSDLIQSLPPELEVEIALEQLAHTSQHVKREDAIDPLE